MVGPSSHPPKPSQMDMADFHELVEEVSSKYQDSIRAKNRGEEEDFKWKIIWTKTSSTSSTASSQASPRKTRELDRNKRWSIMGRIPTQSPYPSVDEIIRMDGKSFRSWMETIEKRWRASHPGKSSASSTRYESWMYSTWHL